MMSVVKRMSAKEDFLQMELKDRKCYRELFEDCRTKRLLEECNCVPWEFPGFQVVMRILINSKSLCHQGQIKCDIRGRDCIEENFSRKFYCNSTCEGIYADVQKVDNGAKESVQLVIPVRSTLHSDSHPPIWGPHRQLDFI